jgi:hypothetical protein
MGPEESGQGTNQTSDGVRGVRDAEQGLSQADLETLLNLKRSLIGRPTIRNLLVTQLTPDQLHGNWEWIKRGAEDILKKIRPHESSSWIPEDLYAAIRYPEASHMVFWMVSRNQKALGWACGHLNKDQYGKLEFVIWDAWDLPLNERAPEDDVEGARDQLVEYIKMWAKANGAWRIVTYSYRKLELIGWTKSHTTYYQPL